MTGITLNQIIVLSNHDDKLSTCSFEDDASWDGASFSGDSFSEDGFDDVDAKEGQGMQITINCIHDALAALSGDDKDRSEEREIDFPPVLRRDLRFDSPPSHPRRSSELGSTKLRQLQSKQSESVQDRFELSQSEHGISKSLRPPSRPTRPGESRKKNGTPPSPAAVTDQDAPPRRHGLTRAQSVRIVSSRPPPARTGSRKARRSISATTFRLPQQHLHSEHGQVTLRASDHRVLMGTRELSTSQHLRRSCPERA
jgi:hypothetical protein